jgi:hypothetical protein
VFLHPIVGNCCHNLIEGAPEGVLEFDFDTTRAVTSLLVNRTFTRYPEVRFIVNHSGAAVPALAGRIQDYYFELIETTVEHIPDSGLSSESW